MTTNIRNNQQVEMLKGTFVPRNDAVLAWSRAISSLQNLPKVRGVWAYGSVDENGSVYDHSGQGRTLTKNGTVNFTTHNSLLPIGAPAGGYLSRADEAGLRMSGAFSLGLWGKFSADPSVAVSKWDITGDNRNYQLFFNNTGQAAVGQISALGTAASEALVASSVTSNLTDWHFAVLRFNPSTSLDLSVSDGNGSVVTDSNTTAIPASIFGASTAGFEIAAVNAGAGTYSGFVALTFLCASYLSLSQVKALYAAQRWLFGGK